MLTDKHFKVLHYEQDASRVFNGPEIKGGIAITLRDETRKIGPIATFTPYKELNSAMSKVSGVSNFDSFSLIVVTRTAYRFTDEMHTDFPDAGNQLSEGHAYDVSTNIFERLPQVFSNNKPADGEDYIQILGRENNSRVYKFVRRRYIKPVINLDTYKLFMSKANGSGKFGEILTRPIVGEPAVGATESFISIGAFSTEQEARNAMLYVSSKFARAMLGILKITQDLSPEKWKYVPLQDFTNQSDIDWSKSIAEIDQQLYKKYGLDAEEIEFIETHVKEMS